MLNKIEVMDAIQGLSRTQVDILKALADRIQQREAEAKRMNLDSISYSYRLTTKDQRELLPDMPIAEATETIWWELSGLMKFSLHRSKKATGCCDRWIMKYQKYQTNAIYIMIDVGMLDIYRKLV